MSRLLACVLLLPLLASAGLQAAEEPFRPRGFHNDSVHRYFPDLNSRLNAVRYGRWRAFEIAWISGINPDLDREFSSYLLSLLSDPPRYPPEPNLVAPRFTRGAQPVARALRWGQMLEQQLSDALASPDAMAETTSARLDRALAAYRREIYAVRKPAPEDGGAVAGAAQVVFSEAVRAAPVSAKILISGTALFIRAAEALAGPNFGEQRWLVMDTIGQFDRAFAGDFGQAVPAPPAGGSGEPAGPEAGALRPLGYGSTAPTVVALSPMVTEQLDLLSLFRIEVFEALIPGGWNAQARRQRDTRLRAVARRYGLPEEGIGGE